MKRALAWILVLICGLIAPVAALAEAGAVSGDALVVGTLTPLTGHFFTDGWGNNTSDVDVRAMIEGYDTVAWTTNGDFAIDPTVVLDCQAETGALNSRVYTFKLNPELRYNDGTPITAKDYVFDVLLRASPLMDALGGNGSSLSHLLGYHEYRKGKPFFGARLLGEHAFSLSVNADFLPYYYELEMVRVKPVPYRRIAPGCDIADDGVGAYVKPVEEGAAFDEASLRAALLDPETGYVPRPDVSCGPYQLDAYDAQAQSAKFSINPNYQGNFEGQKPSIQNVEFRLLDAATMFDELASGRVGLINKVSGGDQILSGQQLSQGDGFLATGYPRAGLNMIAFACELGATQSPYVRRAVACSVDEQLLCDQYLKGFGIPVFGYYGMGQKMAQDQETLNAMARYTFDLNAAANELATDGWIYNDQGELFTPGADAVRHRKTEDDGLEPLSLRCALPQGGGLNPAMRQMLTENLGGIGIELQIDEIPYEALLRQYYRQDAREYNLLQLATNFQRVFDPYYTFSTADAFQGVFNTTGIRDKMLMEAADQMRRVEPGDEAGYQEKWLAFQQRFNDALPMLPMYSNVYFDFYRGDLQDYHINAQYSWASAMVYAYIGDPRPDAQDNAELEIIE